VNAINRYRKKLSRIGNLKLSVMMDKGIFLIVWWHVIWKGHTRLGRVVPMVPRKVVGKALKDLQAEGWGVIAASFGSFAWWFDHACISGFALLVDVNPRLQGCSSGSLMAKTLEPSGLGKDGLRSFARLLGILARTFLWTVCGVAWE
jgi:hypothetical protein